jgi:putative transposase
MILHVLIAMVAGWLQRHQQQTIAYLLEENRVLKAYLGGRRLRFTDTERRLAALAHPLGRQRLKALATLVTPETLLRWYRRLIAQKCDGSQQRRPLGRRVSLRRSSSLCSAWRQRTRLGATDASRVP